ncbi:MAG: HDIG domain-containing protein [Clostridiales bacterium]
MYPNREEAWNLLREYNEDEHLINHALAVEGVMRHFATLYNEDPEKWGITGLLHDLDYEKYPDEHCKKVVEIMEEKSLDQELIRSVVSHGYGLVSDVKPESNLEKVLYTIDELTGLVNATAIMRPSKSVLDLNVKSVKKKFKSKGFAAGVNREVISSGCEILDKPLDEVIEHTIEGMRNVAEDIGLKGLVENI